MGYRVKNQNVPCPDDHAETPGVISLFNGVRHMMTPQPTLTDLHPAQRLLDEAITRYIASGDTRHAAIARAMLRLLRQKRNTAPEASEPCFCCRSVSSPGEDASRRVDRHHADYTTGRAA